MSTDQAWAAMTEGEKDAVVEETVMGGCAHIWEDLPRPDPKPCKECGEPTVSTYEWNSDYPPMACKKCGKEVAGLFYRHDGEPDCLPYASSWPGMGLVVGRMERDGWDWEIGNLRDGLGGHARFFKPDDADWADGAIANADSAPSATALAAVRAMEAET